MSINLSMNVMLVDDSKMILRILGDLMRQLGFRNITDAADGGQALRLLREQDYGLVISDWNMEPVSGLQLLKEVRADEKLKTIPFIMVTAEGKTENVVAAKQAGVNNYIVKPFTVDTLKQKITAVLGEF
ncbi:MAG: response regulator [Alphaproteobacteria bacterium]|nr:MAG: response regulator [Alphaproteobacteria bacterium]